MSNFNDVKIFKSLVEMSNFQISKDAFQFNDLGCTLKNEKEYIMFRNLQTSNM